MDAASLALSLNPAIAARVGDALGADADKAATRDAQLRETAREFESVFIAEMLTHSGLDKAIAQDSGIGGEAFSSMLVQTYADELSKKGGFGLADQIYRQLKDHQS
jgi:Rod binding domain-containing protein